MRRNKLGLGVALALTTLPLSSIVTAEEVADSGVTERITVRGAYFGIKSSDSVKTPTLLVDVPQTISVITEEQIDNQAFTSVADILQYTAGASIGQGEGHRDQMTIRGQNTTADFFIDGLRDDVQYFRPVYNLERVEILKGANALLFGRGGGGGVINRVTKTADTKGTFSELSASIDTFSSGMISVDHNIALDDAQAFRINAFYEQLDNHRDNFDGERIAVNPTYSYELSSDTMLVLSYEHVDDDRVVDRGVPSLNGAPLKGYEETFFGDPDFNRTTLEANIVRARVDHRLSSEWSINGTLQYADYDKLYQNLYPIGFDDVNNTVSLDGYIDTTDRQNLILQINAVGQFSTGSLEHTLLVGGEYGDQETSNNRRDTFFSDSADDQITFTFSDPLVIPNVNFTGFVRDAASDVTFTSVFLQDEIELTEQFILVGGLRFDRFDIDVKDRIEIADGSADGNDGILGRSDSEITKRYGLIYKPMDDVSIYASFSESFLPRSGDQFLSLSLSSEALAPEVFENKELGVKWNATDSLTVSAALFQLDRENGTTVDPTDPERSIITGTETKGFEFQVIGQITENWYINASYSDIEGTERGRVSNGDIDNRTLSQVPEQMFSMWNMVEVNDQWRLGLGLIHQGEQYTSLSNNVELPDFTRVDAAVYYSLSDDTQVQLNIENLFDEAYFPAAHNDNNITTGEGINARLGIKHAF